MRKGIWMYSVLTCITCILPTVAAGNPPFGTPSVPGPHQNFANTPEQGEGATPLPLPRPLPQPEACVQAAIDPDMPGALAVVVLRQTNSQRISFEIRNYASEPISAVIIDGFDALGGQGLFFSKAAAFDGSVRVEYPPNGVEGRGPIILDFNGFGPGQCEAIEAEAGTWGETGFRALVMDMVGLHVGVVFEGGVRGSGEVLLCGSNGRFIRDVPCQPGDGIALISERRAMQLRLPQ